MMGKKCTSLKLSSDVYTELKIMCVKSNKKVGELLDDLLRAFVTGGDALQTLSDGLRAELEKTEKPEKKPEKETIKPTRSPRRPVGLEEEATA